MNNHNFIQEDEIDLRKYIEIIIKRWPLILSVFFIGILIATVSNFIAPKIYKATASLMISPLTTHTHITLLKANIVLEKLIKRLNLKDPFGKIVSIDDLSRKLNIKKSSGEEAVIELQVIDVNPGTTKDIANAWAQEYVAYSEELLSNELNATGNFITNQLELSKKKLLQAQEMVNNFKKEYPQDILNEEFEINKSMLNDYKRELARIELTLKNKADLLTELKKQLTTQEKFIIFPKAISDDALSQMSCKKKVDRAINKTDLKNQFINPIYQNLEMRIINTQIDLSTLKTSPSYLNESIESLTQKIKDMESYIIEKDFALDQLVQDVDVFKKTYDIISNKIQESRVNKTAQIGEVKIISPAILPDNPENQDKRKKVALAGILSLIFGIFLAFLIEFSRKKN